jgi:hypothetical protein
MELEEMKATWSELSSKIDKQKKLTNELILKMAHEKSSHSLKNLIGLETVAGISMAIGLIIGILYFMLNGTLDTWPLIVCSLASIAIFAYSGNASWNFIRKMKKINILDNSIEESILIFQEFNKAFKFYKKLGFYTILPTMVFFIPVVLKVFIKKDIFGNFADAKSKLLEVIIASVIVSIPTVFFLFRYYRKNIKATKEAMSELNNIES